MTETQARELQPGDRIHWDGGEYAEDAPCDGTVKAITTTGAEIKWDDGLGCKVEFCNGFWACVTKCRDK